MFIIKATCDPYNARKHYNGQPVIRYDGTAPVEWAVELCNTEEEAIGKLMDLAKDGGPYETGAWSWEDDDSIKELERQSVAASGTKPDLSWYKGPGIYDWQSRVPILLEGETSFRDDTMQYCVEETGAVPFALVLLGHQNGCRCTPVSKTEDGKNGGTLVVFDVNGQFETSAYIYDDGTLFHLHDWHGAHPETLDEIKDFEWVALDGRPAVILENAPRLLF